MFIEVKGIHRKPSGEIEEHPTLLNTDEIAVIWDDRENDQRIIGLRHVEEVLHVKDSYDVLRFMLSPVLFIKKDNGV